MRIQKSGKQRGWTFEDLKKGLNEQENFNYFLAYTAIGLIALFIPVGLSMFEVLNSFINAILTILLIIFFYKVNGWSNWKNFLSRFIAIGFVALIRSIILILLPLILIFIIILWIVYQGNIPTQPTLFDSIFTLLYLGGYFFLNIRYLKELIAIQD